MIYVKEILSVLGVCIVVLQESMSCIKRRPCLFYEPHCHKHQIFLVDIKCLNQRHLYNKQCGLFEPVIVTHFIRTESSYEQFIEILLFTVSCRKLNKINSSPVSRFPGKQKIMHSWEDRR